MMPDSTVFHVARLSSPPSTAARSEKNVDVSDLRWFIVSAQVEVETSDKCDVEQWEGVPVFL